MTTRIFTTAEKLREVEREIEMRRRVYPGLVARGSLSQAEADRRTALMEAIAEDYRDRDRKENPDLFEQRSPELRRTQ